MNGHQSVMYLTSRCTVLPCVGILHDIGRKCRQNLVERGCVYTLHVKESFVQVQ